MSPTFEKPTPGRLGDHRLRVAFWVKVFPPRYESFIVEQIDGIARLGHHVTLFASRRGDCWHLVPEGCRARLQSLHYTPAIPKSVPRRVMKSAALALNCTLRNPMAVLRCCTQSRLTIPRERLLYEMSPLLPRGQFDVVHCMYGPLGVLARALRRIGVLKGAIVTAFRGYDLSNGLATWLPAYRGLFRDGDLFLPVCEHFRDRLVSLGCPEEKIHVIRSGLNLDRLRTHTGHGSNGHPGPHRVVTVCRLSPKKGVDYALQAVAAARQTMGDLRLDIIGDGPERGHLEQSSRELGLESSVTFHGWQPHDQVLAMMSHADLFVLPSVTADTGAQEGIPNAIKEAMALGKAVLSTRHAGIPEIVRDGETGLLAEERDVAGLAQRMVMLLRDAGLRARLGAAAREHVHEVYDSQRINRELSELYANLPNAPESTPARLGVRSLS